jgi:hypothetical protein
MTSQGADVDAARASRLPPDNEEGFLGVPRFTRSEKPDSGNRKQ